MPALIQTIVIHYAPNYGIIMAFQNFNIFDGFLGSEFIGFNNFQRFLSDPEFWRVFNNTLRISFARYIVWPLPIIFALLLNELRCVKFKRLVQSLSYLPHFISWVVCAALVYSVLDYSTGLVNIIIDFFGFEKIGFMTQTKYFVPIVVLSNVWKGTGWASIIYLATLTSIDTELYDASEVDGAGRFKQAIHITLPAIIPLAVLMLILSAGGILNDNFDQIYNLQNDIIRFDTDVLGTYLFREGIEKGRYSMTTAMGLFRQLMGAILLISANYIGKKASDISII